MEKPTGKECHPMIDWVLTELSSRLRVWGVNTRFSPEESGTLTAVETTDIKHAGTQI